MTTLVDEGTTLVVRCDECRRLWPVTRQRLIARWTYDPDLELHWCPVCTEARQDEPVALRPVS